jgi:hypothetical protein
MRYHEDPERIGESPDSQEARREVGTLRELKFESGGKNADWRGLNDTHTGA